MSDDRIVSLSDLNLEYGRLCQELGHILSNIEKLEERASELKALIKGLDTAMLRLKNLSRKAD